MDIETLKEQAKKIKIIFFDIDDTLRVKDTGFIPESISKVFQALQERGIKIGIASGRSYYGFVDEVKALGAEYYVTINGQYVRTREGEEIYSNEFSKETLENIIAWLKKENMEYGLVARDKVVLSAKNEMIQDAIEVVYGDLEVIPDYWQNHRIYQVLTFTDSKADDTVPEHLKDQIRTVRWHQHSSDIVPLKGSKAIGISQVLNQLNLSPEECMVFGDELNDVEMFQFAKISVAMGNANESLKPLASFVTKDILEDGIEFALKTLELIK